MPWGNRAGAERFWSLCAFNGHARLLAWKDCLVSRLAVLAGTDFFTVEVPIWARSRHLLRPVLNSCGIVTGHPRRFDQTSYPRNGCFRWLATPPTTDSWFLCGLGFLLDDRDTKFCPTFPDVLRSTGIRPLALPPGSSNPNAFPQRWVGSVRQNAYPSSFLSSDVVPKCRTVYCRDRIGG
jgi:hypothetical protein